MTWRYARRLSRNVLALAVSLITIFTLAVPLSVLPGPAAAASVSSEASAPQTQETVSNEVPTVPAEVPASPAEAAAVMDILGGVVVPALVNQVPTGGGPGESEAIDALSAMDILSNGEGIAGAQALLVGNMGPAYVQAVLGAMDVNGDGIISMWEVANADLGQVIMSARQRLSAPPTGFMVDSFFDVFVEAFRGDQSSVREFIAGLSSDTQLPAVQIATIQQNALALSLSVLSRVPTLDHFKCYAADGLHEDELVDLNDQFDAANKYIKVTVRGAKIFCNPTRKIHEKVGAAPVSVGIRNADGHLTGYEIQPLTEPGVANKTVLVRNQFGLRQKVTVVQPLFLLVPTQKSKVDGYPPNMGGGVPQNLDHFKCYSVVSDGIPPEYVRLQDQFDLAENHWENVIPQRMVIFCNPVRKIHQSPTGGTTTTPIVNLSGHLACYTISDQTNRHDLIINNQFAKDQALITTLPNLLCVPSVKVVPRPNPVVVTGFGDLNNFIAGIPPALLTQAQRAGLQNALDAANNAYSGGDLCAALLSMDSFLSQSQTLRASGGPTSGIVAVAEDLYNQGRSLRESFFDVFADSFFDVFIRPSPCFDGSRHSDPRLTIGQSDNKSFAATVDFGIPRMWTVQKGGETWTQLELPAVQSLVGGPGLPAVPIWYGLVAVPNGATPVVMGDGSVRETVRMNLIPFQRQAVDQTADRETPPPDSTFADKPFVKDVEAYATNASFPPSPCKIMAVGQYRDLQMAQVACAAGQYNPVTDELRLFSSMQFSVAFQGGDGTFITSQSLSPFERATSVALAAPLNSAVVSNFVRPGDWLSRVCLGEELLILTHADFRAAADTLATHKRNIGISTNVFNVGPGVAALDTASEIDDFIDKRYDTCLTRPSYVLLVGDAEFIPTFYPSGLPESASADYRYSIHSGFFQALFPYYGVGRLPVDTLDQAQTVVDKIIQYESNPPFIDFASGGPFYTTASVASQFQCCLENQDGTPWAGQPGRDQRAFVETSELVRNSMLAEGYTAERIYTKTVDGGGYCLIDPGAGPCPPDQIQQPYSGSSTPRRYYDGTALPADLGPGSGFAWNGSTADIIDAFNDGRFLILHRDHGWESGWGNPPFSTNDFNSLTNGGLLPVVLSVNCASGYFDNETDPRGPFMGTYFSERLIRKADGGAIAIIGDSRNSPTWANNALTRGFFDAIWPNTLAGWGDGTPHRRLGDVLNWGKVYLLGQMGAPQTAGDITVDDMGYEYNIWHLIGDPTLQMWTANPHHLKLSPGVKVVNTSTGWLASYAVNGAELTALQLLQDGTTRAIARAVVQDGVANMSFFDNPTPGVPVLFSASLNNSVSVALTSDLRLDRPELTVADVTAPTAAGAGQAISVTWTISNTGLTDALPSWQDRVYLSTDDTWDAADLFMTTVTRTVPLPADSSYSVTQNATVPWVAPGQYYLLVRTDMWNNVAELDETNNVQAVRFTVGAPDLTPTAFDAPTSAVGWQTIPVTWTIKNQGPRDASPSWQDRIYLSPDNTYDSTDTFLTSVTHSITLTAGSSYTETQNVVVPNVISGTYRLILLTDMWNQVPESSDANNSRVAYVNIGPPDLTPTSLLAPSKAEVGTTIPLTWTVKNQGLSEARPSWYDRVYLSTDTTWDSGDIFLTTITETLALAPWTSYGVSQSVVVPWVDAGNYYLILRTDHWNNVAEADETNNTRVVRISIGIPDLTPVAFTAPPAAIGWQTITPTWTIKNQGHGDASPSWQDRVYLSTNDTWDAGDTWLATVTHGVTLTYGNTYSVSQSMVVPKVAPGTYYLLLRTDMWNAVDELDETNNERVLRINIGPPDLTPTEFLTPAVAKPGQSVPLTWTVKNQGLSDTLPSWYDRVYLSTDRTYDSGDTMLVNVTRTFTLLPGTSYTASRIANLPKVAPGIYYLILRTDQWNNVAELDETNNEWVVPITIGLPDLTPTDFTVPPTTRPWQVVSATWTVKNQGPIDALPSWEDRVYLSSDAAWSSADSVLAKVTHTTTLVSGDSYTVSANVSLPGTGTYYLIVRTDVWGQVAEQDETNNAYTMIVVTP